MPAHTSASAAVGRVKSDGKTLTAAEWRANDLADRLAKKGAASTPLRVAADDAIKAAGGALLFSAAKLGVITLEANCHRIEFLKEDGEVGVRFSRDSTPMPAALAKAKLARVHGKAGAVAAAAAAPEQDGPPMRLVAPLVPLTHCQARQLVRRTHAAAATLARVAHTAEIIASAASSSTQPPSSAAERMAALRARIGI